LTARHAWPIQVDEAVIELVNGYSSDCGRDPGVPGRPSREPRREGDQYAKVVPTGSDMVAAEPGEVTDILGEQHVSPSAAAANTSASGLPAIPSSATVAASMP
jgi:hypothetical protein